MAVPTDYIAYYPFTNNADDLTGNHDGVNSGVVFNGESGLFDGIDYVEVSPKINLSLMGFTVTGWIKKSDISSGVVINNASSAPDNGMEWGLSFDSIGESVTDLLFTMFITTSNDITTPFVNMPTNRVDEWIFFTIKVAEIDISTYTNAVLDSTNTTTDPIIDTSLTTVFGAAGWDYSDTSYSFNGNIKNVRFYDYPLDDQDITDIYNEEKGIKWVIFSDTSEDITMVWDYFTDSSRDLTPTYQTFSDVSIDGILAPNIFQDVSIDHQGFIQIFTDISANNENIKWSRFYDISGDETTIHEDTLIKRVTA